MTQIQERIHICIAKIIQQNPQVKNIFDEIYQQGGRVLLVGGAVRDCLLGCLSSDLDFEVYQEQIHYLKDDAIKRDLSVDYAFISPQIFLKSFSLITENLSDHYGILLELEVSNETKEPKVTEEKKHLSPLTHL